MIADMDKSVVTIGMQSIHDPGGEESTTSGRSSLETVDIFRIDVYTPTEVRRGLNFCRILANRRHSTGQEDVETQ